jgi:hypothetical protein
VLVLLHWNDIRKSMYWFLIFIFIFVNGPEGKSQWANNQKVLKNSSTIPNFHFFQINLKLIYCPLLIPNIYIYFCKSCRTTTIIRCASLLSLSYITPWWISTYYCVHGLLLNLMTISITLIVPLSCKLYVCHPSSRIWSFKQYILKLTCGDVLQQYNYSTFLEDMYLYFANESIIKNVICHRIHQTMILFISLCKRISKLYTIEDWST